MRGEMDHTRNALERSAAEVADLRRQLWRLRTELLQTKRTLAHRIGVAIVKNLGTPWRWLMIPFSVVRAYHDYRLDKQRRGILLAEHERRRGLAESSSSRSCSPVPMKSIVWQAQQLADEHGLDYALEFVRAHHEESAPLALRLLEANSAESDTEWLRCVNDYLAQFGIHPIELSEGTAPRFHRISAPALSRVSDGPLVSVIVPAYNAEATVEHALSSILRQTWEPLEVIVVDDCSTDGTWDLLQEFAKRDDRVTILRNSVNVGPYVSKNRALELVRGTWITGHDADDWAHPQRIERQVAAMRADPRCKVGIGQMIRMSEDGVFTHFSKVGKTSDDGALRLCSISCMFDAEFFKRHLGHWDCVRFGGDSEMIERCRTLLGDGFRSFRIMTMLCLDGDRSLTNHPVHGVSKETGISPSRRYYREEWTAWHKNLKLHDAYLDFPPSGRKFGAPVDAVVTSEQIVALLRT